MMRTALVVMLVFCAGFTHAESLAAEANTDVISPSLTNTAHPSLLPCTVDLRPNLRQWGLVPRTQGERPTCSVFTVVNALEFGAARKQGYTARLSVEYLNWAGNEVIHQNRDGGFFSDLWKGFSTYGICSEEDFPYQPKFSADSPPNPSLRTQSKRMLSLGLRFHWIKEWDVKTGLTPGHLVEIKRTLSRGWPVCGGFRWPKKAVWEQGVLQMCPPEAVYDGHSVLLIGCRDEAEQPGGGVFIFRNTSGDGRDGAMPYAYAQAFMNDAAWIE